MMMVVVVDIDGTTANNQVKVLIGS